MSTHSAGPEIERLIALLAKLPGLGPRSARRVALHLLKKRDALMRPLAEALAEAGLSLPLLQLGLPDHFIEHGDPGKLLSGCGLDAAGIERSIAARFGPDAGRSSESPAAEG